MSTHARIGYHNPTTNKIHSVYLQNDGGDAGEILKEYYNNPPRIMELLSFGNMSVLHKNIHPCTLEHSFKNREEGICLFYGRDRGEENQNASITSRWDDPQEYNYLYKNGAWHVRANDKKTWRKF